MKAKRFVAIGLLTAAAIALVGCAIALGKKNKQYQPKVMQTNAYYEYESITNSNNWTLNYEQNEVITTETNAYVSKFDFTFTMQNRTIAQITLKTYGLYYYDGQDPTETYYINATTINTTTNNLTFNENEEIDTIQLIQTQILIDGDSTATDIRYKLQINTTERQINRIIYTTINLQTNIFGDENYQTEIYLTEEIPINNFKYIYSTGYTTGYQTKDDLADGNFIDIRNMMLSVLTMPFTFINQAFNVTLWEGTAYAFNVGNFIKGIIAIATILFIIRLFTSGFSIIGNYTNDARARKDTSNLRRSQTEQNKAKTRRESKLADKGK